LSEFGPNVIIPRDLESRHPGSRAAFLRALLLCGRLPKWFSGPVAGRKNGC